ncbi:hypothetical protein VDP97_01315 [Xanthomonas campestris pv. campestris]|uniref:hypothetical protein n=1 Tax=Xanthomonas campestris TaxID=339 RepID=UPI00138953C3|nr:hypothetical protein [Xanthomonas campestris]MBD8245860.1 hypothetical protein [Xanthomonas campestris]MCC5075569.1 hypothetical protein [Xanthomonas campestris pv. campestris]MCF8791809.1 hypothetical protein [Xanthomonas campestris pv. campestris]MCF8821449.1 hypothetical protein [Xanthomonas campestris pv. campestris]MCF8831381.1 hypothetical protein [Xanthomonas campestris pv. campestris]
MSGHDLDLQSVGQTNNNHSHLLIKSHSHLDGWIFALGHVFDWNCQSKLGILAYVCAMKRISYAPSGLRRRDLDGGSAQAMTLPPDLASLRSWPPNCGNDVRLVIDAARSARTS